MRNRIYPIDKQTMNKLSTVLWAELHPNERAVPSVAYRGQAGMCIGPGLLSIVHSTVEKVGIRTDRRNNVGVKTSLSQYMPGKSNFVCALLCTAITQKNTAVVDIVGNFAQGYDK